jgi:N-6 DNA Methylase
VSHNAALDTYLDEVRRIRATKAGTAETSYYPAISLMLNLVGATLHPHVFCLHHPSGDAGIPDFGLFEQAQFKHDEAPAWTSAVNPERGVVEAKGASHNIATLLASKQIKDQYLPTYGLVLATNLWQFRLVAANGAIIETFDLAADEAAFWKLATGSRPDTLRERFDAFVTRCLLTKAPLRRPSDVAFFLASYAREALGRLSERATLPGLAGLRKGMEDALGIKFVARDGERLFRSTLVQTLFYGLFSAWVVHARAGKTSFDWRVSQWSLHVPVMRLLFGQIATPEALEPLGLVPLLDAAGLAMERIERPAFFQAFNDAQAVQYFYEPFLRYYDPELRRQLGVWYTPPEIVHYQVERVDRVLRSELGVKDGLANPDVWVLDPCCGTGSYLVAVLDRIRRTLNERGLGDLVAEQLKKAATTRIVASR